MPLNRVQKRKRFRELVLRRYYPSTKPAEAEVHVNSELNVAVEHVPAVSITEGDQTPVVSNADSVLFLL